MTSRVLVVTGGSTGIGAEVARLAVARGYAVGLSYRQGAAAAAQVVAGIEAAGGRAVAVQADAADATQTAALFAAVDHAFGPVTALVVNAGVTGRMGPLDDLAPAEIDEVFAINVRGAFLALQEAVRRMATDRGGSGGAIVNVSSRAAVLGGANEWVHYAASKGALDTLTIGAAKELAPRGIRVNAVAPGLIDTPIHAKAGLPDRTERLSPSVPLGRPGSAAEVAQTILWLLSEEASFVTGAVVPVGGGR